MTNRITDLGADFNYFISMINGTDYEFDKLYTLHSKTTHDRCVEIGKNSDAEFKLGLGLENITKDAFIQITKLNLNLLWKNSENYE